MKALILDASIAVKLVTQEADSAIALIRVASATEIIAPDWLMIEVVHALWKKVRRSSFDEALARAGIAAIAEIVTRVVPASTLMPAALDLSFTLPHPIEDCLYLALAQAEETVMLTADAKFADRAKGAGFLQQVEYLSAEQAW